MGERGGGQIGSLTTAFQAARSPLSAAQCQNPAKEKEKRKGRYTREGRNWTQAGSFPTSLLCCVTMRDNFSQVDPSSQSWVSKRPPWGVMCQKNTVPGGLQGQVRDGDAAGKRHRERG